MRILTLQNYYLPGYRGGGCIRAVSNLVAALGSEFEFLVVCNDRDLGSREAYPGVAAGEWTDAAGCRLHYTAPANVLGTVARVLRGSGHDAVYLNSIFERRYALWPLFLRRLGLVRRVPFAIAPRGEVGANALAIRGRRKRLFLAVATRAGLFDGLTWHATSHTEVGEIERFLAAYRIAGRLVRADDLVPGAAPQVGRIPKPAGKARLVFLSRIVPKKNLDFALRVLAGVHARVEFDIYGPKEDASYWSECEERITALPANVTVRYRGVVAHQEVASVLSRYDLFFLPTRNENFGYVIHEALGSGCPVLLSDQTPWGEVSSAGAGWIFPLDAVDRFAGAIEETASRGDQEQREWSDRARKLAARTAGNAATSVEDHRQLFQGVFTMSCP